MQTFNTFRLYELGSKLHTLLAVTPETHASELFVPLTEAQTLLDTLIKGEYIELDTSKTDANKLLTKLGVLFNRYFIDPGTKQLRPLLSEDLIDNHEMALLRTMVDKFEQSLSAELSRVPSYVASKRGIYSLYELAEHAEKAFGELTRKSIPKPAQSEFNAAGRALAFGMGTAAVLHLLRSIEYMVRSYYDIFGGQTLSKNERTFSIYLKRLSGMALDEDRQRKPDTSIIQLLTQIKDHYRNPLLATEKLSTLDEAFQLFGMATTLIALMANAVRQNIELSSEDNDSLSSPQSPSQDDPEVFDFPLSQTGS